jgi:hypothetical protein
MQTTTTQKRAIDHYYKELAAYHTHKVTHETAVRSAFQNLLATYAQSANWILIPEQALANGKRPAGTLCDSFNLPRGYWEAKDTKMIFSPRYVKRFMLAIQLQTLSLRIPVTLFSIRTINLYLKSTYHNRKTSLTYLMSSSTVQRQTQSKHSTKTSILWEPC